MPIIKVKTYYLEMLNQPDYGILYKPEESKIDKWINPKSNDYLKMYKEVGDDWGWTGRTKISESELESILKSSNNHIYELKIKNNRAGFIELFEKSNNEVEIIYFGLLKEYIGKGIGGYLLKWGILKAWDFLPNKVTVHTCEYDAKQALNVYKKFGFKLDRIEMINEYYEQEFLDNFNGE